MTFVPIDFNSVEETKPVDAGRYDLIIAACDVTKTGDKSKVPGTDQFKVSIGIEGEDNAPNISHYITLLNGQEEKSSANFKILLLKRFLHLFKIPYDPQGIDLEQIAMEMVGCRANAEVSLSEPDDNGNVYNRLVVPRIPNED